MNTFAAIALRDLTCATAALLITVLVGASFVQSTALPPGAHADAAMFSVVQPQHAWFGQPEPAVLVD